MRRSRYFLPTLKEAPREAQITSHQLMLRAGLIDQHCSGIYAWLPLGTAVLQNIATIVREEQNKVGAQEIIMPTIQSAELWKESNRYEAYGEEMLRIQDRHGRELLYTPTAEEVVTAIARTHMKSYRDLPAMLYQINWKFRDEIRPRFGVMRGREFLMKDGYSVDLNEEEARASYKKMMTAYVRTFRRLGLTAVPARADTGPIGGDLSHEFLIVAKTGESELFYEARLEDLMASTDDHVDVEDIMSIYAATEDIHDPAHCPIPASNLKSARGIEVGHIFYFGTKYSEALGLKLAGPDNTEITPHMGSYGIGVSRLVAAIIEASHDEKGIIWPESVAPFKVGLVNIRVQDAACVAACDGLYEDFLKAGISVLYDDRDERPGVKFADMELIGLPWSISIGPRGLENGTVEVRCRKTDAVEEMPLVAAKEKMIQRFGGSACSYKG
jgi:prolyl-tRNA synthetase